MKSTAPAPARCAGDADAGAVERLLRHQVGDADFLEQLLHEQAVIAAIVGDDGRERRRIHHQRTVRRDHRRKAGRKAAEPALERVAPGGVDQGDLDAGAAAVDLAQHRLQAEAVAANIRLGPDLRIDRDHIALAVRLDAEAREENQRDRAGLDLAVELVEGAAHRVAGQVFADIDGEAVALEFVGDVAGVVDRLLQRRFGVRIFRVADDQRKAVARCKRRGDRATEKIKVRSNARRIFIMTAVQSQRSAKKAPIPACASATLLYANRIIKPRQLAVNGLRDHR